MRLALALGACAIAACAPSARSTTSAEPPIPEIEITRFDRLLARGLVTHQTRDTSLFLNPAQVDSVARAVAGLRLLNDTAISMFMREDPIDYKFESVYLGGGLVLSDSSAVDDNIARCAQAARVAVPPDRFRQGAQVLLECWPALAEALSPISDVDVRIMREGNRIQGLTIWTDLPINIYTLSERLRQSFPGAWSFPSLFGNGVWPAFDLQRLDGVWRLIFRYGWGDCPSGCIHKHYFVYRWDPARGRAWKDGECGEPLPDDLANERHAVGRDMRLVYCPAGVGNADMQAPAPDLAFTPAPQSAARR